MLLTERLLGTWTGRGLVRRCVVRWGCPDRVGRVPLARRRKARVDRWSRSRRGIKHRVYRNQGGRLIDSPRGRRLYGRRIATVEPVFANLRHPKGLDRFTVRGQKRVSTQWQLFCLVHNIEKMARRGG